MFKTKHIHIFFWTLYPFNAKIAINSSIKIIQCLEHAGLPISPPEEVSCKKEVTTIRLVLPNQSLAILLYQICQAGKYTFKPITKHISDLKFSMNSYVID